MKELIYILAGVSIAGVLGVMIAGAVVMTRANAGSRNLSNRLMKMRVVLQALAVFFLALAALVSIQ